MAESIHQKVKRSLQAAEGLYYRLVLLVGKTGPGKTDVLREVADEFGSSIVNVNLALSSELLEGLKSDGVRTRFKKAWQENDYAVIVAVANKISTNVLKEDPKLLMWYDQAITRMGGE